jgi:hypothetical protein
MARSPGPPETEARPPSPLAPPHAPVGEAASSASAPPSPIPTITLPKGGGAIRGIGEKFEVQPSRGTAASRSRSRCPRGATG